MNAGCSPKRGFLKESSGNLGQTQNIHTVLTYIRNKLGTRNTYKLCTADLMQIELSKKKNGFEHKLQLMYTFVLSILAVTDRFSLFS